jgi:glycerate kinase
MVRELDQALNHVGGIVARDLGVEILNLPGGGAAGGLGAGLAAFANGKLQSGVEIVMDVVNLPGKLIGADLVLTGEGRIDGQTINGKTPWGVAREAKKLGLPVLAVAGGLGPGVEAFFDQIDGIMPIVDKPMSLEEAIRNARILVTEATERLMRIFLAGKQDKNVLQKQHA